MNFLELCKKVAKDSGTLAGGAQSVITTGASASGRASKIVDWTRDAWINIQNEHDDWLWMRREFEALLTPGKARYTAAELGVPRLGVWLTADDYDYPFTIQEEALGKRDEAGLGYIDYSAWRARYHRGHHDPARPTEFSVSPLREIVVGATPDRSYVMRGLYVLSPQVLTNDTDVPEMPEQYHSAIIWEALKLLAIADEAPVSIQTSVGEYSRARDAMSRDLRPRVSISYDAESVIA